SECSFDWRGSTTTPESSYGSKTHSWRFPEGATRQSPISIQTRHGLPWTLGSKCRSTRRLAETRRGSICTGPAPYTPCRWEQQQESRITNEGLLCKPAIG